MPFVPLGHKWERKQSFPFYPGKHVAQISNRWEGMEYWVSVPFSVLRTNFLVLNCKLGADSRYNDSNRNPGHTVSEET